MWATKKECTECNRWVEAEVKSNIESEKGKIKKGNYITYRNYKSDLKHISEEWYEPEWFDDDATSLIVVPP